MTDLIPVLRSLPMIALVAGGLSGGAMTATAAFAQSAAAPDAAPVTAQAPIATLTVTGEGVVRNVPDMAELSVGVTTNAKTAAEALAANSEAVAKVISLLKAAGVADHHLQTAGLSVSPDWGNGYSSSSGSRIEGYTANNVLNVKIMAIGDVGAILDAAVATGANSVNGPSFGLQDQRSADDAARKAAVVDARVRAELLAEASGMKLGAILSVTEGESYGGGPVPQFKAEASSADVPVELGDIATRGRVTVVWQLLP